MTNGCLPQLVVNVHVCPPTVPIKRAHPGVFQSTDWLFFHSIHAPTNTAVRDYWGLLIRSYEFSLGTLVLYVVNERTGTLSPQFSRNDTCSARGFGVSG